MIWYPRNWWRRCILKRKSIPESVWQHIVTQLFFLQGLTRDELRQLRQWTTIFLHAKKINGVQDLVMTDEMRVMIAIQACLLILKLDPDYYDGWVEVIVYPGKFILDHEYIDENGIVHTGRRVASGESWLAGPVILSWEDVTNIHGERGYNVVIHEFAHKLDMLNGSANGFPPLHRDMDSRIWTATFSEAYAIFCEQVERGEVTAIDPYAAENPAEFFAVLSEVFFVRPHLTKQHFPEVYQQLAGFYRQDPAARQEAGGW